MNLFKRHNQTLQPRQPANLRGREPLRRTTPSVGQGRTFSYYAARSQAELNTGREANQNKPPLRRLPTRLQRLRRHAGWIAGGLLAIGLLAYQLQLSTQPKVVSLADSSDAPFLKDTQVYQEAAHKLLESTPGNRNKLTINATDISTRLQKQFPELQEVSVTLPVIGDKPTVFVRPAAPSLILSAANGSYVIDANGRALAEANAGANLSRLKVPSVTDQSALAVKLGDQVLPSTAVNFIATVAAQLAAQHYAVQSMTLPAAAGELDAYISDKPYFVKFNLQAAGQEAAELQSGTFVATAKKLEREGAQPSQYIDVRLEGRAYYK